MVAMTTILDKLKKKEPDRFMDCEMDLSTANLDGGSLSPK